MPEQETPQTPLNPDLAGYPDVTRLVDGYRSSSDEAKRQRDRADKYEALLGQMVANGVANPRQSVPDRSSSPEDRLTDLGVPVDALSAYVDKKLSQAFEPISRGMQARGKIVITIEHTSE